ncbi:hypothetical protein LTR60_006480, partial [Cryomyces antarcticus]
CTEGHQGQLDGQSPTNHVPDCVDFGTEDGQVHLCGYCLPDHAGWQLHCVQTPSSQRTEE